MNDDDGEVLDETPTHRLLLLPDNYEPTNPRDWRNVGVMFTGNHRRYELGDQPKEYRPAEYDDAQRAFDYFFERAALPGRLRWSTFVRYLRVVVGATEVLPLYLLDHSGLSMSTSPFACDPGGWDSGVLGVIFDTPRTREETGCTPDLIRKALIGEVKEYDRYLTGDCWGYRIERRVLEPAYAIHSVLIDGAVAAVLSRGRTLDEAEAVADALFALNSRADVTVSTREVPETWTDWDEVDGCWGYLGREYAVEEAMGAFSPFKVAA